ncbi:MAG: PKD domain-containing protein [Candidatus Altiarchaeia archaeon]
MEKSVHRLFFIWLIGISLSITFCLPASNDAYAVSTDAYDSILLANVGGPYSGEVGQEISFDGSGSREAKNIESYLWDFGDGETGNGRITTHRYMQAGFYNATLAVIDFSGEKNIDRTGVYIRNVELSVEAIISPGKAKYEYGDSITSIDVIVRYPNNSGVERATVSGAITGKRHKDLRFTEKGIGRYHAEELYPILKDEGSFVEISVKAVDAYGNSGERVGKILVSPADADFKLILEEPADRVFSYGQRVRFKARLNTFGKSLENDSVSLYEGWSGKNYSYTKKDGEYYYTYEIPRDAQKEIAFLVNGKAVVDGKPYTYAEIIEFGISNKLSIGFIEPTLGEYASNVSRVVLNITYPNGEQIRSDRLKAVVNGEPAILNREDLLFVANHTVKAGERILKVSVEDSMGNTGTSEIQLIPENTRPWIDSFTLVAALSVIVVSALLIAASLRYYYTKRHKDDLKREYEELKQQREALKKLMKTIMHEYYTRKITSEDAKKRMLDYEKELLIEREKMRSVLHKLGIKMETEGKEEVIEWIVEKLDQGEDPELLKEGLADTGIDPKIVDDIKKNLI